MNDPVEHIPDAYCDICHQLAENCECPECEICGVQGDPTCINAHMPWGKWSVMKHKQEERAKKWADLAMEMISELRQDYAPGALPELEGPKAVRKLRARLEQVEVALRMSDVIIERYADHLPGCQYHVGNIPALNVSCRCGLSAALVALRKLQDGG